MAKEVIRKRLFIAIFLSVLLSSSVYASSIQSVNASELTSEQKALSTLNNVVGIDLQKYNIAPTKYTNDLYQDVLPRENVHIILDSEGSKINTLCTFVNGELQLLEVFNNEGSPHMTTTITGIVETAQNLLGNYQTQSKNSFYGELNSMLAKVDANKNSTSIAGNIKLQITTSENDTTFRWTYTVNGIESPDKCVALRFKNGFLKYFFDSWNLYRIGSTDVNLSEQEAIDIAMSQIKNYSRTDGSENPNKINYDVTNAMIIETILSPSLYVDSDKAHSFDLLELYPLRHVWVSLDKFYPGNVYGFNVYIWADTKQVCYVRARISTLDPPAELCADLSGESSENQPLNNALVEPNTLTFIAGFCAFAIVMMLSLSKNRKRKATPVNLRKPRFLKISILFLCVLLSSSVWVGLSTLTVKAEPYHGSATVWGAESIGAWNDTIPNPPPYQNIYGSSWRKVYRDEVIWQRSTSQYIANLFQFNGYASMNNQGTSNQTSNKDAILTQISSNEAGYPRVAVVDFDHGNGKINTTSAIPGANYSEFHYMLEDNFGTREGGVFNENEANANYHAVFDSEIYNRTTGKTFFAFINTCNSANVNATFGNDTATQGIINPGSKASNF